MSQRVRCTLPVGWLFCRVEDSGRVTYVTLEDLPSDLPALTLAKGYLAPAVDDIRRCIRAGLQSTGEEP